MNMLMKAPASTFTNGFADSPATACAMRVLPVPGGPHSRMPAGHVATPGLDRFGILQEDQGLLELAERGVLALHVVEPRLDLVGHDRVDAARETRTRTTR